MALLVHPSTAAQAAVYLKRSQGGCSGERKSEVRRNSNSKGSTVISFACIEMTVDGSPETKGRASTILANIIDRFGG